MNCLKPKKINPLFFSEAIQKYPGWGLDSCCRLSWTTGHRTDAYIILVVVLIDALIGFIQEWKAEQAVSALHKMLTPHAKVLRDNQKMIVIASELVPGDVIILEEGDYVPADARLFEIKHLRTTNHLKIPIWTLALK